jgi:hypothetical protein
VGGGDALRRNGQLRRGRVGGAVKRDEEELVERLEGGEELG